MSVIQPKPMHNWYTGILVMCFLKCGYSRFVFQVYSFCCFSSAWSTGSYTRLSFFAGLGFPGIQISCKYAKLKLFPQVKVFLKLFIVADMEAFYCSCFLSNYSANGVSLFDYAVLPVQLFKQARNR